MPGAKLRTGVRRRSSRHRQYLAAVASAVFFLSTAVLYLALVHSTGVLWTRAVGKAVAVGTQPGDGVHGTGQDRFALHPEQRVFRGPRTIRLAWNVTKATRAPDGVRKAVYLINGQCPGPLIEARSGDGLVIVVRNSVAADDGDAGQGIAMHWHGLLMKGANEMDGVVGLTQCAIGPHESFTYRYHAHSGVQRADGLYGGLVVHRPAGDTPSEAAVFQYEADQLLLLSDWYHRPASAVLAWFTDPSHYVYESAPDSLLVNGCGSFDCSRAVKARPVSCSLVDKPVVRLAGRRRVRLRVFNAGISSGLSVAVTGAVIRVISVDGGNPVAADTPAATSVGVLYPGERIDVVVDRMGSIDAPGASSAELSILLDKENMGLTNFALVRNQYFPLPWKGNRAAGAVPGTTTIYEGRPVSHFSLAQASGVELAASPPVVGRPVETAVLYTAMQVRAANHNRPVGTVNHTSWAVSDPRARPLLALDRAQWPAAVPQPTSVQCFKVPWLRTAGQDGWMELVLNNLDDKGHPFHLHGFRFFVLSRRQFQPGEAAGYNPLDPKAAARVAPVNPETPLGKDTVYVPAMGYVVLRLPLDNDGLWLLHCHVLWHQAVGMGIVLQVGQLTAELRQRASASCPA